MEPTMGVPIDQAAKSQNNLLVPVLSGFSIDVQRFSNMTIPLFWLGYVSISSHLDISHTFSDILICVAIFTTNKNNKWICF